jgi:hypothetical protein
MKITGFTSWLVETEPGPKFIWRDGLPGSHGDIPHGSKPRKAVIRMETDSGLVGAIEMNRGDAVIDLVRRRYQADLGDRPHRRDPHARARHPRYPVLGRQIAAR